MNSHTLSLASQLNGILKISRILTKEHLREPSALLWTGLAPCLMFMIVTSSYRPGSMDYQTDAAWFYAYISANVAFFGFSFYLIGRRESGFIRSFIYQRKAILLFLASHTTSYTIISILYCSLFYAVTKPLYGHYSLTEFAVLLAGFYTGYLAFSCIGLAIAALPLKFSTAGTLFSVVSFLMLVSGYAAAAHDPLAYSWVNSVNPLFLTTQIVNGTYSLSGSFIAAWAALSAGLLLTARYFRIQPIWSRYS